MRRSTCVAAASARAGGASAGAGRAAARAAKTPTSPRARSRSRDGGNANDAAAKPRQQRQPPKKQPQPATDWRPRILAALLCAQVLLALTPGLYRSTDFEVHRNWLAVTDALPRAWWYVDATSPGATLDYPPFFAWFEWGLGRVARLLVFPKEVADKVLRLQAEPVETRACVVFQRLTVVATGLALPLVAWWWSPSSSSSEESSSLLFFLVTCNAGLLMVDNVHFQYNGVLLALLLLSILLVERGGPGGKGKGSGGSGNGNGSGAHPRTNFVLASVAFSALLNAKHLFAYAAPAFFVHLLRVYVLGGGGGGAVTKLGRLAALGAAVVAVFAASLAPFYGSLSALASRLFPFGRGLLHAYWAPNAWALYAALDKALAVLLGGLGGGRANMAGGLVGVAEFAVLPQVGPRAAAAVTCAAMLPVLVALWRGGGGGGGGGGGRFAAAVAHCLLCGFVFGYHVHEKAVLTFLLPMALVVVSGRGARGRGRRFGTAPPTISAVDFMLASTAGHVGIFPLLFRPQELLLRWAVTAFYFVVAAWGLLERLEERGEEGGDGGFFDSWRLVFLYAGGCALLEAFNAVAAARVAPGLPFLPLLLTSVWAAWPIALVWARGTAAWWRVAVAAG